MDIRTRLIELLKEHTWYAAGNLGVPGMPDQLSYKCYCGWQGDDPHGHVADSITSGIGLHEDRYRLAFAADDCDYDKVRYSNALAGPGRKAEIIGRPITG